MPVYLGTVQGLELFRWFAAIAIAAAVSKVVFAAVFLNAGFGVAGALAAFLMSSLLATGAGYTVIRSHVHRPAIGGVVDYRSLGAYLIPVGLTTICFMALSNIDMILVRYFFSAEVSGRYSIAQMVGKIFLFLPSAISLVMFPRSSGLHAQKDQTSAVLYKSLVYAGILCILATLFFNAFPAFVLRVLTGKVFPESILLGRLFGVSMSFFALSYIMMMYFLSVNDTRFIPVVLGCVVLELIGILLFHQSLIQIQATLCVIAAMLFTATIVLSRTKP
jgi:O-antigen/teichoic acid export membrane protein